MENIVGFLKSMTKDGKVDELINHLQQANLSLEDLIRLLSEAPDLGLEYGSDIVPVFNEVLLQVFKYVIDFGSVFYSNLYEKFRALTGDEVFKGLFWAIRIPALRKRASCVIALCAIPLFYSLIEWTDNGIKIIEGEPNRLVKTHENLVRLLSPNRPAEKLALLTYHILRFFPETWREWWNALFEYSDIDYTIDGVLLSVISNLKQNDLSKKDCSFAETTIRCWRWGSAPDFRIQQLEELLRHFEQYNDPQIIFTILEVAEKRFSHFDTWNSFGFREWQSASDFAYLAGFFEFLGEEWSRLGEFNLSRKLRLSAFEQYKNAYKVMGQTRPDDIISHEEIMSDFIRHSKKALEMLRYLMIEPLNLSWMSREHWNPFNLEVISSAHMLLIPELNEYARKNLRLIPVERKFNILYELQSNNSEILVALYWSLGNDVELLSIFLASLIFSEVLEWRPETDTILQALSVLTNEQRNLIHKALIEEPVKKDNQPVFLLKWDIDPAKRLRRFLSFVSFF